jgi:uncharacterized cupin superfamily protein
MPDEARLVETESGLEPDGPGWFVVNVRDAAWSRHDNFGAGCVFENREAEGAAFTEYGINIQVIWPGQPNCMYHGENQQEDMLVLAGECLLLVEDEERHLQAWDFVHLPPDTRHVFVGAGDGPCAILMVGTRKGEEERLLYPVDELALRHGAGVPEETPDPGVAYAPFPRSRRERLEDAGMPWQQ